MLDLGRVSAHLYGMITPVIEELTTQTQLDPDNILLVGAGCRDILHAALGHDFQARATSDTDLGIAVNDWAISEHIEQRFQRIGSNGIRYLIANTPVDVMPFGKVEDPEGISFPAPRGEDRLYESEAGNELLAALDWDVELAAVRLLSKDAAAQLSSINRDDLARRWKEQDLVSLARDFTLPAGGPVNANLARRQELVKQLGF